MGAYKAAIVTEGGQNMIAQALAENKSIMFTSAKTSSYAYPLGTNIVALTGLQDIVQSVIPTNPKVVNENVAQVSARFDNDGITQQYQIQTIGLYAKIEGETEALFSVTQAITPDEMPIQSSVSPSAFIYNIQLAVQNAAQISVTVNPAGTATVADIMAIENPEFDDSGVVESITSFPDFLETFVSKMSLFKFLRNLKAGLQFVLHAGSLVNNCTSTAANLPLAAAQGKVLMDLYTQLNSELTTVQSKRSIWRGKNLGSSVTDSQWGEIQAGTFSDLYLGDYWEINGHIWRIVDFDYWLGTGDIECIDHHLVIMPDHSLGSSSMNTSNTTAGGYVGTHFRNNEIITIHDTTVAIDFPSSHLLSHREYITTAVVNGYPSVGRHHNSITDIPNEIMMYGSYIFTPSGNGSIVVNRYTVNKSQLAGMKVSPTLINPYRENLWLRDVVSDTSFACVDNNGVANYSRASDIFGIRLVFGIK